MAVCLNLSPLEIVFKIFLIDKTECLLYVSLYVNFALKEKHPNLYFNWIKLMYIVKLTHKSWKEKYFLHLMKEVIAMCIFILQLKISWLSLSEANNKQNLESLHDN